MVWFAKDLVGGWQQLELKLAINNLELRGCKIPLLKSAIPETLADLYESCVSEGAVDLVLPKKAQTYTALVIELKELGLIKTPNSTLSLPKENPVAPIAFKTAAVASSTPSDDELESVQEPARLEV